MLIYVFIFYFIVVYLLVLLDVFKLWKSIISKCNRFITNVKINGQCGLSIYVVNLLYGRHNNLEESTDEAIFL